MVSELEFDPFIDEVARELKSPVRLDARFDDRVMAALQPAVIPIASRRAVAPWYRRQFSFSLGGLAAAAAMAGVAAIGVLSLRNSGEPQVVMSSEMALVPVADVVYDSASMLVETQFIMVDPSATSMSVVGQFNGWDASASPMTFDAAHNAWSVRLALPPGRYEFQYVIDGTKRVNDPTLPQVSSDFGTPNSVITVVRKDQE